MRDRLMGALIAITLASSLVALAQTNKQAPPKAQAPTATNKPFDAHDLSGFWDITNSGLLARALNETSNNRPQMTPWGSGKVSQDEDGRCQSIKQCSFPERKRLESSSPVVRSDGFPTHYVGPDAGRNAVCPGW